MKPPHCEKCGDTGAKSWGRANATGRNDSIVICDCLQKPTPTFYVEKEPPPCP